MKEDLSVKKNRIFFLIIFLVVLIPALSVQALCIKVSKANLRAGPGKNYRTVWQVYMYMPLEKVGQATNKNWYAVRDADGDTYWVHKGLVTNAYRCAIVNAEKVNVRKGPGTNYGKVEDSPAQRYYSYRVISQKGKWTRVRDEWGSTGWIMNDLLWIR